MFLVRHHHVASQAASEYANLSMLDEQRMFEEVWICLVRKAAIRLSTVNATLSC